MDMISEIRSYEDIGDFILSIVVRHRMEQPSVLQAVSQRNGHAV